MDPATIYFFSTNMPLSQAKKLELGKTRPDFIEFEDVTSGGIKGAVQRWDYFADGFTVYISRLTLVEKAGIVYGSYEPTNIISKEEGKVSSDIVRSMTFIR
ncbi:MAG: hypothetical protein QG621_270 [Patescibacteria group bacterium]|nr:hypothetical protein [Patescibacteria group bacterium]